LIVAFVGLFVPKKILYVTQYRNESHVGNFRILVSYIFSKITSLALKWHQKLVLPILLTMWLCVHTLETVNLRKLSIGLDRMKCKYHDNCSIHSNYRYAQNL